MKYTTSLIFFLLAVTISNLSAQSQEVDSLSALLKDKKDQEDSSHVDLLNEMASLLTSKDAKKSRLYSTQALDMASKIKYKAGIGRSNRNIARSYFIGSDYKNAIKYFLESVKVYEDLGAGKRRSLAISMKDLGASFFGVQNSKKSLEYYNRALKISLDLEDQLLTAGLYNNIGVILMNQQKPLKARSMFKKALSGYRAAKQRANESIALSNIGDTYDTEKTYEKALEFYTKSLQIDEELKEDYYGMAITLRSIGEVCLKIKNYEKAQEALDKSLKIARELDAKDLEQEAYEAYSDMYEQKGEYQQSLKFYKKHTALKDSIFNKQKSGQIVEMQTKYETEKKEKELALKDKSIAQKDKEISDNRVKQRTILIGMLLIISVAFFVVSRQRLRNRKNKEIFKTKEELIQAELKNAEQDLKFKNKELTTYALHIIQKNNILTELKDSIQDAVDDMSPQEGKRLNKLIHLINYSFNLDRDWKDFKIAFEQVHEGFFEKLQKHYPNISPSETRLCALLRLNFASKEIAAIMGISPDSVKVARYRLRKKLELSRNDSLVDFIRNM